MTDPSLAGRKRTLAAAGATQSGAAGDSGWFTTGNCIEVARAKVAGDVKRAGLGPAHICSTERTSAVAGVKWRNDRVRRPGSGWVLVACENDAAASMLN